MASQRSRLPGTPEPMHHITLASGATIAADSWGPETSRTVVLLHGGGQTRHAWRGTGRRLGEEGYHTVAVDLRGHGDSSWDEQGDYAHDALIQDLVGLLDRCGWQRPVLIGASLGGALSLLAVGEGLIESSALVIVDTAPRLQADGVERLRSFMTQRTNGFASLEEIADAIAAYNPSHKRSPNLEGLIKNVRIDDAGRYHWHWDPAFMRGELAPDDWKRRQARMERSARSLSLPTLLVRGGLSDLLSEEGAAEFLAACPHSEYVNVADATHMVSGDRNDRFTDGVVEFLGRVAPAGDPE